MLSAVVLAVLAAAAVGAHAMNVSGTVKTEPGTNWVLLSSFCYDTDGLGEMRWLVEPTLISTSADSGMQLAIYDDERSSFPSVWPQRFTASCNTMVQARKNKVELKVPAKRAGGFLPHTRLELFNDTNSGHQWFIAVAGCDKSSLSFDYTLSFNQGKGSPFPTQSAELQDVPAPTVFYAIFMVLAIVAFVLITLRASRAGLGPVGPLVHKLVGVAVVLLILANFCAWAWSAPYDHPVSSLRALLFFQGLCQTFIMLACGFLAVANKRLEFIGRMVALAFFIFALLYWLPFFIQGLVQSDFPGVPGAETFANGWSVVASLFRFFAAIAWGYLSFLSFKAAKLGGGAGEDQVGIFQWFIMVFAVFLWLFVYPIAIWANMGNIYSCNPSSLVAGYAIGAIFDGLLIILLVVCVDPAISRGIFGDILGSGSSPIQMVSFHLWAEADWTSGGGASAFQSSGYSTLAEGGIGSDDFADGSGTAAAATPGSANAAGGEASYQTL